MTMSDDDGMRPSDRYRWLIRPCGLSQRDTEGMRDYSVPREKVLQERWDYDTCGMSICGHQEWRDVPVVKQSLEDYRAGRVPGDGAVTMDGKLMPD